MAMPQIAASGIRADVLAHAHGRASGANVHRVANLVTSYVFACERRQHVEEAIALGEGGRLVRAQLNEALADVERLEAEVWRL